MSGLCLYLLTRVVLEGNYGSVSPYQGTLSLYCRYCIKISAGTRSTSTDLVYQVLQPSITQACRHPQGEHSEPACVYLPEHGCSAQEPGVSGLPLPSRYLAVSGYDRPSPASSPPE